MNKMSVLTRSRIIAYDGSNSVTFSSPQVSAPVDYSNPPTIKNHNEVLRCFSILGTKALQ